MATRYIDFTHKVAGSFTDATSVVLSDPTGTYGIKRNDTNATVVADGTALTKTATGTYTYTFTEPVEGIAYTAYVEWVYNGLTHRAERSLSAYTAASTLFIQYSELRREIGRYLGFARDPATPWTADQITDVADILQSGLRRFYWPPSIEGKPSHEWSFLRPSATLGVTAGTAAYTLPENFGSLQSGFTYATAQRRRRVAVIMDEQLRAMQAQDLTGPPQYCAVRAVSHDATVGQRYQVSFYPTPDASYTLTYRYAVTPDILDATNEYPLGGAVHSETILEACLSAADVKLNDEEGIHEKRFLDCLGASIRLDEQFQTTEPVWPQEGLPTDLSVNKAYLLRMVGIAMEFGPHPMLWSEAQEQMAETAIQSGLRKFYAPPLLQGETYAHDWSFLRPLSSLTTVADDYDYDLPKDFAGMDGPLTFAPGEDVLYRPLAVVSEHMVRLRLEEGTTSSRPEIAAIRPLPYSELGTRYELLLWPTPDDAYTIQFRYRSNPGLLVNDNDVPFGGTEHAQTIVEACMAAAEELGSAANGPHGVKFQECLRTSVSLDRTLYAPETLGYNRDPERTMEGYPSYFDYRESLITFNGVQY